MRETLLRELDARSGPGGEISEPVADLETAQQPLSIRNLNREAV
jgi:hypothetical protein